MTTPKKHLWVFTVDRNPMPWEDWSVPNRIFKGTDKEAYKMLQAIDESHPDNWLWNLERVEEDEVFTRKP